MKLSSYFLAALGSELPAVLGQPTPDPGCVEIPDSMSSDHQWWDQTAYAFRNVFKSLYNIDCQSCLQTNLLEIETLEIRF